MAMISFTIAMFVAWGGGGLSIGLAAMMCFSKLEPAVLASVLPECATALFEYGFVYVDWLYGAHLPEAARVLCSLTHQTDDGFYACSGDWSEGPELVAKHADTVAENFLDPDPDVCHPDPDVRDPDVPYAAIRLLCTLEQPLLQKYTDYLNERLLNDEDKAVRDMAALALAKAEG
eukprot:6289593-Prymnesium_polylepis.1